jgi:hypothetical protein
MPIRRAILILLLIAAPGCARWEPVGAPRPAAEARVPPASAPAAQVADNAVRTGTVVRAVGEQQAPVPAAEHGEASAWKLVIVPLVAAGALAVFLLLAHVNC